MLGVPDDELTTYLPAAVELKIKTPSFEGVLLVIALVYGFFVASCSSSSLHEGAQTGWLLPSNLRDLSMALGRCLPHKKHDIVAAPKDDVAAKGDPGALDL